MLQYEITYLRISFISGVFQINEAFHLALHNLLFLLIDLINISTNSFSCIVDCVNKVIKYLFGLLHNIYMLLICLFEFVNHLFLGFLVLEGFIFEKTDSFGQLLRKLSIFIQFVLFFCMLTDLQLF